jgi:hypothetical protein
MGTSRMQFTVLLQHESPRWLRSTPFSVVMIAFHSIVMFPFYVSDDSVS